jgi:hypothetical protein
MVIDTTKQKIVYYEPEKQYIVYRILTKSEMRAHLANAQARLANEQNAIDNFQAYIDDERVEDEKPEEA